MTSSPRLPLIGLDYGQRHVGLAFATTPIAEPDRVLPPAKVFAYLKDLHQTIPFNGLVLGVSEGRMASESLAFGQSLSRMLNCPLYTQDETLSSYETRVNLAKSHLKRSKREAKVDHYVAAAILQDFIDAYHL